MKYAEIIVYILRSIWLCLVRHPLAFSPVQKTDSSAPFPDGSLHTTVAVSLAHSIGRIIRIDIKPFLGDSADSLSISRRLNSRHAVHPRSTLPDHHTFTCLLQIFNGIGPGLKLVVSGIGGSQSGPGKANSKRWTNAAKSTVCSR